MQNRFVGDIGDFANHGILRALCGTPEEPVHGLNLGVVEYFNIPAARNLRDGGGQHIEYLKVLEYNNLKYRRCDLELYEALRRMVGESLVDGAQLAIDPERSMALLPVEERYYGGPIVNGERAAWLNGALADTATADVIFVNPDNGIRLHPIGDALNEWKVKLEQETDSPSTFPWANSAIL